MVFASFIFLFWFVPLFAPLYAVTPARLRNVTLILGSFAFYGWWRPQYVLLMLVSVLIDYFAARWMGEPDDARKAQRKRLLLLSLVANLGMLGWFKYANLFVGTWNDVAPWPVEWEEVVLPVGISFFTFQSMSYTIDVYRGDVKPTRSIVDLLCFVSMFPQLIAGPIVRYRDIAESLQRRVVDLRMASDGVLLFAMGFAKKVLVADSVAPMVDQIYAADSPGLIAAWLGALGYAVQIYFDFSGYSDMAIGLGRMLGFRFLENFDHPYISRSITEFWRRWHISLSTWFRDYLYIPLGGNRGGAAKTARNLVLVFLLCGLWHGAALSFVLWGLYHGAFLVLERAGWKDRLDRLPTPLRHGYVILVFVIGWVLFRAPDASHALKYVGAMFGLSQPVAGEFVARAYVDNVVLVAIAAGVLGSMPWLPWLQARKPEAMGLRIAGSLALLAVFLLSILELSAGTYNPFIYFRF